MPPSMHPEQHIIMHHTHIIENMFESVIDVSVLPKSLSTFFCVACQGGRAGSNF